MLVFVALWLIIKAAICRRPLLLLLAYIALVVGIHHTRRLVYLSLASIALAVRIHRTHQLLIHSIPVNGARSRRGMATNTPQGHGDE